MPDSKISVDVNQQADYYYFFLKEGDGRQFSQNITKEGQHKVSHGTRQLCVLCD